LLWDYLEFRTNVDRLDSGTWQVWPRETFQLGMVQGDGTHCDGVWYVRGLSGVQNAFAQLFGDRNLHCSFDGFAALRTAQFDGPPNRDWYHIDHSLARPKRWLAQGFVSLTGSGKEDGGLVVWPCSHRIFDMNWGLGAEATASSHGSMRDFTMLRNFPHAVGCMPCSSDGLGPVKLQLKAGDLALWDSRTLHCNAPVGPVPDVASRTPALAELAESAEATLSRCEHVKRTGAWSELPALDNHDESNQLVPCDCRACRHDFAIKPSEPLGRLGVYVCMQPSELTETPAKLREAMIRYRSWTGHAPFRDVANVAQSVQGQSVDSWLEIPLIEMVANCKVRLSLAGIAPGN